MGTEPRGHRIAIIHGMKNHGNNILVKEEKINESDSRNNKNPHVTAFNLSHVHEIFSVIFVV